MINLIKKTEEQESNCGLGFKPGDLIQWYPILLSRNGWVLCREERCLASIRHRGMFPIRKFTGTHEAEKIEIKLIDTKISNNSHKDSEDKIVYCIEKELFKGEWDTDNGKKREWGRLEFSQSKKFEGPYSIWTGHEGPNYVNVPARIVLNDKREFHIWEKIEGNDKREYSIVEWISPNDIRVLAITERPPTGNGIYRIVNIKENDPNPIMLAIVSFAFAEIVFDELDAKP